MALVRCALLRTNITNHSQNVAASAPEAKSTMELFVNNTMKVYEWLSGNADINRNEMLREILKKTRSNDPRVWTAEILPKWQNI